MTSDEDTLSTPASGGGPGGEGSDRAKPNRGDPAHGEPDDGEAETRGAGWQRDLERLLTVSASRLDDALDSGVRRIRRRLGREGVPAIQSYIGYGDYADMRIHGRVLTNPISADHSRDDWWRNVGDAYQRFASDEVPGVTVEARVGDETFRAVSDREGYFRLTVPHHPSDDYWVPVPLRIVGHPGVDADASTVLSKNVNAPREAEFGVISDIDDTILHTGATNLLWMARRTLFANARTRAPLAGVGALYQTLHRAGDLRNEPRNPVFYVSSSPWNLFDLLEDFIELNEIPLGPILLRDLGFDEDKFLKTGHDHKLAKVRQLMTAFGQLPFVLVGDSGQEDPRLYAEAAVEFGSRITAVFIRDVDPLETSARDESVQEAIAVAHGAGVPMHLVRDSEGAARIAMQFGLLPAAAVDPIRRAVQADLERHG